PALGDLDLAVGSLAAVADHEVVAAAVPALDLAVLLIDLGVATRGGGAVVEDDVLPGPVGLGREEEVIGVVDERLGLRTEGGPCGGPLVGVVRGRPLERGAVPGTGRRAPERRLRRARERGGSGRRRDRCEARRGTRVVEAGRGRGRPGRAVLRRD